MGPYEYLSNEFIHENTCKVKRYKNQIQIPTKDHNFFDSTIMYIYHKETKSL